MSNAGDINFSLPKTYQRVIQFELNEIAKPAIDYLMARGKLPNFSQINHQWLHVHTTSEEKYELLEPWIQWITAHTGKPFTDHQIFHLSDAAALKHPQIWETLSDYGIESGIVGSMNAVQGRARGGFFFPDPWSKDGVTQPTAVQPLWNLISKKVHSHATASITLRDIFHGLRICLGWQFPWSLYQKIAKQFILQKINPLKKWQMAAIFDLFLSEIFKYLLKSTQYRYYTLFLNAVAHYQHHYWRNFQRGLFNPAINSPDCEHNDDPMTMGYEIYDQIIGDAIKLAADPSTLVIIASGLAQEPFTAKEHEGGMNYYRLRNHQKFANQLGLTNCRILPLMSRDWQVETHDAEKLNQIKSLLTALTVNKNSLFNVTQNTAHSLFIETAVTCAIANDAVICQQQNIIGPFHHYFHRIAVKSGHHIGKGSLWLSQKPAYLTKSINQIPLTELYSLTLQALGVEFTISDVANTAPHPTKTFVPIS